MQKHKVLSHHFTPVIRMFQPQQAAAESPAHGTCPRHRAEPSVSRSLQGSRFLDNFEKLQDGDGYVANLTPPRK